MRIQALRELVQKLSGESFKWAEAEDPVLTSQFPTLIPIGPSVTVEVESAVMVLVDAELRMNGVYGSDLRLVDSKGDFTDPKGYQLNLQPAGAAWEWLALEGSAIGASFAPVFIRLSPGVHTLSLAFGAGGDGQAGSAEVGIRGRRLGVLPI